MGIAASLAFGLGTDTRLTLSYFHMESESMPDYGIPWVPAPSTTAGVVTTYTNGLGAHINDDPGVPYDNFYGNLDRDYEIIRTDVATVQFEHESEKWLLNTRTHDMRDHRQIDGRQHRLARAVTDHLLSQHHLLVALRNEA